MEKKGQQPEAVPVSERIHTLVETKYISKRRSGWVILYESLIFIQRNPGEPKTHLMYGKNLSFTQSEKIIKKLVKEGLIEMRMENNKSAVYITDKGRQAIKLGREFLTLLGYLTLTGAI